MEKQLADTTHFVREGFSGDVYISNDDKMGFTALRVVVNGKHPKKRMIDTTRAYLVQDGTGTFTIDDVAHDALKDSLFVIKPGSEYEYEGKMVLFEFNISPENSFKDEMV